MDRPNSQKVQYDLLQINSCQCLSTNTKLSFHFPNTLLIYRAGLVNYVLYLGDVLYPGTVSDKLTRVTILSWHIDASCFLLIEGPISPILMGITLQAKVKRDFLIIGKIWGMLTMF